MVGRHDERRQAARRRHEGPVIDLRAQIADHRRTIDDLDPLVPEIEEVARLLARCLRDGHTVFWLGNGGSAADSQHLAAELVGRFTRERPGLPSVALTTDTSILTAVGNDYGIERVFSRQVEALCRAGDVVVCLSTSGNSPNVLAAVEAARRAGAATVGMTGRDGGELAGRADRCLRVPATVTARIQEAHILIGHLLCDWVEADHVERADG